MSKSRRKQARLAKKAAKAVKDAEKKQNSYGEIDAIPTGGKMNADDWRELKFQKAITKRQFTRYKNRLLELLDDPDSSEEEIFELKEKVRYNFNKFTDCLGILIQAARDEESHVHADEIVKFENEMTKTEEEVTKILQISGNRRDIFFEKQNERARDILRNSPLERDQSPGSEIIRRPRSVRGESLKSRTEVGSIISEKVRSGLLHLSFW